MGLKLISMPISYQDAVDYFSQAPLLHKPDGSIDFEAMAGEFLVEGVPMSKIKPYMDAIANHP